VEEKGLSLDKVQHILAPDIPRGVEIVSRQGAQHARHDVQLEGRPRLFLVLLDCSPGVHSRIVHDSLAMVHDCGDRNQTRNVMANGHESVCCHTDDHHRDYAIHPGSVNVSDDGNGREKNSNRHLQLTDEEAVEGFL
jgi:hypothetical protein